MLPSFVQAPPRKSTFKLINAEPYRIDLKTVYEDGRPTLYTKAIYELKGIHLVYCVSAPGLPRPTSFATKQGDGSTLVVLKRVVD